MANEYWTRRALENDRRRREQEEECCRRLQKAFEECEATLEARIEAFYSKYAGEDGKVSIAEESKYLSPDELVSFRRRIAQLEKTASTDAEKKELERLKARVHISRQEALLAELQQRIVQLGNGTVDTMYREFVEVYRAQEKHNLYNLEQEIGYAVDFARFSDAQLEALIRTGYDGRSFSEKVWYDNTSLVKNLNTMLPRLMLLGTSVETLSRDLSKAMNTPRYAAERLVRTEGSFLAAQADKHLYEQAGLRRYEFLATLDDKTSDICIAMDGQVFLLSQAAVGVNLPPLHPNCRSTTLPVLPDDDDLDSMRLAKDVNGNYIQVPKQSYSDWARRPEGEYVRQKYYDSVEKWYGRSTEKNVQASLENVRLPNGQAEPLEKVLSDFGYKTEKAFYDTALDAVKRLLPDAEIGVRVHASTVEKVLQDGIYRSGASTMRRAEERLQFGIKEGAPDAAYPVYGALLMPDELKRVAFDPKSSYGDQVLVLKRGQVEGRATFTLGDSLNNSRNVAPSDLTDPQIRSVGGIYRASKFEEATTLTEISAKRFTADQYAEVQIRGGFTLDDIAYIRLTEEPDPSLKRLLTEKGVGWTVFGS